MLRLFNSLQFRLILVLVILIGLSIAWNAVNARSVDRLTTAGEQIELASLQRSNSYLLSSLAQRLDAADDETQLQTIEDFMRQTIANVDANQDTLRNGDAETDGIESAEVLTLLDELDGEWEKYRSTLQTFLTTPPEERNPLLAEIDNRSVAFFTFSDRVVVALLALQEQNQASDQQVYNILIGIAVITTLFVTVLIVQIALTVRSLTGELEAFASGNLGKRTRPYNIREINNVGQVFNSLANRLQSLIVDLNKQVKEAQVAREAAERSDQVKSAFLASMSHELRTPLNAVINLTKFVAQGDLGPVNPEQEETLMESVDSARHLLHLINDVLDMSKIEAGSLNLFVRDDIDLEKIIESMTTTARSLIGEKSIEVRTEISSNLPQIRGDEQRIRQILLNIISNATKFTDEGHIEIRARTENSHVIIAVKDTGPGIAVHDQEAVFEAFRQTDTGLRKGGGTGLGMPISRNLTEIHGGKLWLESEVGKGSTFFVALPIRSEDLTPAL